MQSYGLDHDVTTITGGNTGALLKTAGKLHARKDNLAAGAAPTVNDDVDAGYEVGSLWIYGSAVYQCTVATADNAVWQQLILSTDVPTQGSVLYFNGTIWKVLPPGLTGHYLMCQGAGADPMWAAVQGGANSPSVISISPTHDEQGVTALDVTINGTSFVDGANADFGAGITVTNTAFVNAIRLTATIDIDGAAALGLRDVTVTNPDFGAGMLADAFTVDTATPVIDSIDPVSIYQGETLDITINGHFFQNGAIASFSGAGVTVNHMHFISSTELTANVSVTGTASVGARTMTVTNPDAKFDTLIDCLTVVSNAPIVDSIDPVTLVQGDAADITISGHLFQNPAVASFEAGVSVSSTDWVSATELTAHVTVAIGATLGTYDCTVTNPDAKVDTLADCLTVTSFILGQGTCVFWLYGDDLVGADASAIAAWTSKEGNAYSFAQAAAGAKPTLQVDELNGKNVAEFDGATDFLEYVGDLLTTTAAGSLYIVFKTGATEFVTKAAKQVLISHADEAAANVWFEIGIDETGRLYVEHNNAGSIRRYVGSTFLSTSTWYTLILAWDNLEPYATINGIEQNPWTVESVGDGVYTWFGDVAGVDGIVIGAACPSATATRFFEGMIAEIAAYSTDITA